MIISLYLLIAMLICLGILTSFMVFQNIIMNDYFDLNIKIGGVFAILAIIVLVSKPIKQVQQAIDNQKYFEHQYKYVNTISVDPYENKTIMNNSDKVYVMDENGIFDEEDRTILPGYDYTYRNKSGSRKNIDIYEDPEDVEISDMQRSLYELFNGYN